ncbi:MAG: hypothetical protein NTW86_17725, partial [Candidatus Sumerlaeota bacterium]|nr:hypothetical protein [Candidatus Sumerlaeota bacterium]
MTQNVVTYTVEVATDNSSGRLLPYLTANVDFELARRGGVLLVPNSALRWTPRPELLAAGEARKGATESTKPASNPATASAGRWEATPPTSSPAGKGGGSGVVWVPDGNHVRPIHVRVGLSDGTNTEAQGEGLTEGIEVVLGEEQQGAAPGEAKNPFTPQLFRQKNPSGGGKAGA